MVSFLTISILRHSAHPALAVGRHTHVR
jgi:hypothetical protein